ncbi:hypothetical protein BC830DRAFT_1170974 [Chytriomyces sp. MP71]|nr:hypothetical protein BC830DRAFT_1170974 [Chytriomyces sp. MP71]
MLANVLLPVVAVFAQLAAAHYDIQSPAPRAGSDDLTELVAPCGGLPLGGRSSFPITAGSITGGLYHPSAVAQVSVVFSSVDPAPSQFGQVFVAGPGLTVKEGYFTIPVDLSSFAPAVDGATATFQVVMVTPDGTLYTCIDVTLKGNTPAPPASSFSAAPVTSGFSLASSAAPEPTTSAVAPTSSDSAQIASSISSTNVDSAASSAGSSVPASTSAKSSSALAVTGASKTSAAVSRTSVATSVASKTSASSATSLADGLVAFISAILFSL